MSGQNLSRSRVTCFVRVFLPPRFIIVLHVPETSFPLYLESTPLACPSIVQSLTWATFSVWPDLLWGCNFTLLMGATGCFLKSRIVVATSLTMVSFAHLSWCVPICCDLPRSPNFTGKRRLLHSTHSENSLFCTLRSLSGLGSS
jgi:hypothetical protein